MLSPALTYLLNIHFDTNCVFSATFFRNLPHKPSSSCLRQGLFFAGFLWSRPWSIPSWASVWEMTNHKRASVCSLPQPVKIGGRLTRASKTPFRASRIKAQEQSSLSRARNPPQWLLCALAAVFSSLAAVCSSLAAVFSSLAAVSARVN